MENEALQPQTELQIQQPQQSTEISFGNKDQFEHAQRVAVAISKAAVIPEAYRNNIPNTLIAMDIAQRMNLPAVMVMQNLYVVHGKPAWSGQFTIAAINGCGRFTPLRFEMKGEGDTLQCRAWANDKKTGERLNGTLITMAMANGEGWVNKSGSKWKTMPEQMMQYRAGAFFGRVYCPDILMGMSTVEEVEDFTELISDGQMQFIESLVSTSTFEDSKRRGILWECQNGISSSEAKAKIAYLQLNQLAPQDRQNMNAGDAKNAVKNAIAA